MVEKLLFQGQNHSSTFLQFAKNVRKFEFRGLPWTKFTQPSGRCDVQQTTVPTANVTGNVSLNIFIFLHSTIPIE